MISDIRKSRISVVIPIHNEFEIIEELFARISHGCRDFKDIQVIFVDDGSSDLSWSLISKIARNNLNVKGIRLTRNFGHQKAVLAGLNECNFEYIAIIDGDLQDPPELIPEMVKLMNECKVDIVYGQRLERDGESFLKKITAKYFYRIFSRIVSFPIPLNVGDFRVFKKHVLSFVLQSNDPFPFLRGLFAHLGFSSRPFMYNRESRYAGKTKYGFRKMFKFALDAVFGFSDLPFKLFLRLSLATLCLAFIASGFAIYHSISVGSLPGWMTLFVLNLYMGSMNFLFLSLIGKYVTLSYEISLSRPRWVIGERVN